MDLTKKAKDELEDRIDKIEAFIASKGVGATYLKKAQKTQRDINLALLLVGVITVAGIAAWVNGKNN